MGNNYIKTQNSDITANDIQLARMKFLLIGEHH